MNGIGTAFIGRLGADAEAPNQQSWESLSQPRRRRGRPKETSSPPKPNDDPLHQTL